MTASRVIFAVILVLFGFGLYGLHRDVAMVRSDLVSAGKAVTARLDSVVAAITSTKDRVDQIYNLTYGKATIHRPAKRVAAPPKALPPHKNFWDEWFKK